MTSVQKLFSSSIFIKIAHFKRRPTTMIHHINLWSKKLSDIQQVFLAELKHRELTVNWVPHLKVLFVHVGWSEQELTFQTCENGRYSFSNAGWSLSNGITKNLKFDFDHAITCTCIKYIYKYIIRLASEIPDSVKGETVLGYVSTRVCRVVWAHEWQTSRRPLLAHGWFFDTISCPECDPNMRIY